MLCDMFQRLAFSDLIHTSSKNELPKFLETAQLPSVSVSAAITAVLHLNIFNHCLYLDPIQCGGLET